MLPVCCLHTSKGLDAATTFIVNPSLCPLVDRLALGGIIIDEYEEKCLAYIARSRARRRLVYLKDLDNTSRAEVGGIKRQRMRTWKHRNEDLETLSV